MPVLPFESLVRAARGPAAVPAAVAPRLPRRAWLTTVSVAALLALNPAARAQEAAEAEAEASPEGVVSAGTLQSVTVTADRRREAAKDVPSAVSILSGEKLQVLGSGGEDIRFLAARVPSLNLESSFGRAFPRAYIRGYGNTDFRLNASQPVSLVYDDVVQENSILKGFPVFDIEQVEVLRGPQGTLFGRNTPAGVIKFDSVRPQPVFEGYGSLSYGRFDTVNAEGAVNLPIAPDWAARVSLLAQRRSDWVENRWAAGPTQDLEGYRDLAWRGQLLFEPHSRFSALLNLHARNLDGTARLFRANILESGSPRFAAGYDRGSVTIDGRNEQTLDTFGGSLRLRWDLGPAALHAITGYESLDTYSRGDVDGGHGAVFAPPSGPGLIPFSSETADGVPELAQWSQELRLESTGTGPLGWQAGVFVFDEDVDIESFGYDSLAGGAQNAHSRSNQHNRAYAVFGALSYELSPRLSLRGGLRYTRDSKSFALQQYDSAAFGTPATIQDLAAAGPISARLGKDKLGWDLAGSYRLDADTNLYGRVAHSFRGASVQGAGQFNAQSVADPETATAFEAGVKADLWERRGRIAFGLYHYTVKDQQLTAVGGDGNSIVLMNADRAVGQGLELDFQAYLTDRLLFTTSASYNHTKIRDAGLAVSVCAQCTVTDPLDANGRALIDGNPLPQAPRWIANLTLRYGIPTEQGEWFAYTDWAWRSAVNFFLYESLEFEGRALLEGGLRLGYAWDDGRYEVAGFVRNLTDTQRVTGGIDFNNLTGFVNEPRTWGIAVRAAF